MARKVTREIRSIVDVTRYDTSPEGNPRFRVHFTDGTSALTEVNSGFGYAAENWRPRGPMPGPLVIVSRSTRGKVLDIEDLPEVPTEWVTVPEFYVRPGDWADHRSRTLDPRQVTQIEGGQVWLDLLLGPSGPYPARNYTYERGV